MNAQKGARRTSLMVLLLLLVTVPLVAGFLIAQDTHDVLAVDLRGTPAANDLKDWQDRISKIKDSVIAVVGDTHFDAESCPPSDTSSYCAIRSSPATFLVANPTMPMSDILRERYGVDIQPGAKFWQGTVTTSTGSDVLAAVLSFVAVGALGTVVCGTLLRRPATPARAVSPGIADVPQRQYRPQRQMAGVVTGPPRHQPVVSAVQSVPPAREIAAELMPLVTRARGHAVARTHITARGGYVDVGGVVVWAVLRPSDEAVVVPDDRLEVLGVDEETETVVVTPAGSTPRHDRPGRQRARRDLQAGGDPAVVAP
jgi:hypothetical protein